MSVYNEVAKILKKHKNKELGELEAEEWIADLGHKSLAQVVMNAYHNGKLDYLLEEENKKEKLPEIIAEGDLVLHEHSGKFGVVIGLTAYRAKIAICQGSSLSQINQICQLNEIRLATAEERQNIWVKPIYPDPAVKAFGDYCSEGIWCKAFWNNQLRYQDNGAIVGNYYVMRKTPLNAYGNPVKFEEPRSTPED